MRNLLEELRASVLAQRVEIIMSILEYHYVLQLCPFLSSTFNEKGFKVYKQAICGFTHHMASPVLRYGNHTSYDVFLMESCYLLPINILTSLVCPVYQSLFFPSAVTNSGNKTTQMEQRFGRTESVLGVVTWSCCLGPVMEQWSCGPAVLSL